MNSTTINITVTGAAGKIGYNTLFYILSGFVFDKNVDINICLLDLPVAEDRSKGFAMELSDCAFPCLKSITVTSDINKAFEDSNIIVIIGSIPMKRDKDFSRFNLLEGNIPMCLEYAKAINKLANRNVKVFCVTNPCNTLTLLLSNNAPDIPRTNFFSLSSLDLCRAKARLAEATNCVPRNIKKVTIWGNHSDSLVADYSLATSNGKLITEILSEDWLKNVFEPAVKYRGKEISQTLGTISCASAAYSTCLNIKAIFEPTAEDDWFSAGVCSKNNPYGFDENLWMSLPCKSKGDGSYEVIKLTTQPYIEQLIEITIKDLIKERDTIRKYLI